MFEEGECQLRRCFLAIFITCTLRGGAVLVGYIDIDSFKAFNTKYGETSVDRYLLPRFMRTLEAHTLFHGHTYRFGGDEYMVLLPNMSFDHGMNFLADLPRKLSVLDYGEITEKTTVSIGVCIVEVDTF